MKEEELPELKELHNIIRGENEPPELIKLRNDVDEIDNKIVGLLGERREMALQIRKIKKQKSIPPYNKHLEDARINLAIARAKKIAPDDPQFHKLAGDEIKLAIHHCRDHQFDKHQKAGTHKSAET